MQRCAQFILQLFQALDTAAGGDNLMAFANETAGDSFAESGRSAGDKNDHVAVPQLFLPTCAYH
jgi:hypothetical protein